MVTFFSALSDDAAVECVIQIGVIIVTFPLNLFIDVGRLYSRATIIFPGTDVLGH